jgi:glutamate/tyrosine decarboxylase-like PLP-dependent enzyme
MMEDSQHPLPQETLDPENWDELRTLAHRMVDDMFSYLQTVGERPAWQPIPDTSKEQLNRPIPMEPLGAEQTYTDFMEHVRPYPMGNIHPRFWGWVMGGGTPMGMMADMLASGMNPNMGGGDHGAVYVEQQVIAWCKQIMSFPQGASGLLVSGGSMANLVGLTVARNAIARFDIRQEGLQNGHARMVLYASTETHSSNEKAVEMLGLGEDSLRLIAVNDAYEIDIPALEAAIAADKAAGMHPFCVIGHAGTVNTGALDNLDALADICAREDMWFHVDGAFGSLAVLDPEAAPRLKGMECADSIAFDLHKWMYMPFEVGCVLVRSEEVHRHAFSLTPEYLAHAERGLAAGKTWFSDYGVQLTRGFRALKVWMSIKEQGLDKYARLIHQNIAQAQYLSARVARESELELVAPTALNVVNYRYTVPGMDDPTLNKLNEEILLRLQESGIAVPSSTTLHGRYAIRLAIVNHRSRWEDFDLLADETLRLGRELVEEF